MILKQKTLIILLSNLYLNIKTIQVLLPFKNVRSGSSFHFCEIRVNDIYKEIKRLIARKAAQSTDILVTILKEIADILSAYFCNIFKATIRRGKFPSILKNVDTTESPQSGHLLR